LIKEKQPWQTGPDLSIFLNSLQKNLKRRKRQYNEKYGYTITVPALGDIIHLRPFEPLTEEETALWKARKYEEIPKNRLKDIRNEKARKKAKFLSMMGSPTPKIPRAAGAILTAFDDLQDAVSTLACIGLMTAAVVGGTTAALLAGPLGWVVGASAALNLINPFSRLKGPKDVHIPAGWGKRIGKNGRRKNPFTKKARARVAKNITKFKPRIGNAIEALQVTDNVFGVGLSLGPIMGFAMDVISAKVRGNLMQKVDIKMSPMWKTDAVEIATRALKSCSLVNGYVWESDFMDEVYSYIGANLAMQVMAPYIEEYNPIAEVEDLATYKIEAPRPRDILTLEIIQEAGYTVDEVCNWPQNSKRWISYDELSEKNSPCGHREFRSLRREA